MEYVIEGLNPDGEWVRLDRPVKEDTDPLTARDRVVKVLRDQGVTRYSRVRVMKVITTMEQHGGTVDV